jgi:hypothetical protein
LIVNTPSSPRLTVSTASPSRIGSLTPSITCFHAATSSSFVPSNTGRYDTFCAVLGSAMKCLPLG